MQCSAVQCSAVQCSAVQCSAVQCSVVQCSAVQCILNLRQAIIVVGRHDHGRGENCGERGGPGGPQHCPEEGGLSLNWMVHLTQDMASDDDAGPPE